MGDAEPIPERILDPILDHIPAPARSTAYGPDPAQVYDVRLARGPARGVTVVIIHGGFWRAAHDRAHAGPEAQAFAEAGYPTAVLEYRRAGMPGGGWPGTLEDVAAGIQAVWSDPGLTDHLVLVGHSAGGQLAVWAAGEPWSAELVGVVSLGGVLDLTRGWAKGVGNGAIEAFLGGSPQSVPDRYAGADPARRPRLVPLALIHGVDDEEVPAWSSRSYADHAPPSHAEMTLRELPGVGHYELIDPRHPAFQEVLAAVDRLASYAGPHA